jgi:prepilin-type N-terminal cleavage/methylation domain-containing protein
MSLRQRSAFTMIELMLVIAIMLLATAVAVPTMVRSLRGARLRSSARTVVMVHRYARSMAVLGQKQIGVLFDKERGKIEIVSVTSSANYDERSMFLEQRSLRLPADEEKSEATAAAEEATAPPAVASELQRNLAEGVKIEAFAIDKEDQEYKGIYWVNYYPNGMLDKWELLLQDEYRKRVTITVDQISGKAKVEYE